MVMHVDGGLEPRWGYFGGFEPVFHFPMVMHENGGLEPRWEFDFDL